VKGVVRRKEGVVEKEDDPQVKQDDMVNGEKRRRVGESMNDASRKTPNVACLQGPGGSRKLV